jgi:hypothetical protein
MNQNLLAVGGSALVGAVVGALILIALTPRDNFCKETKNHCIVVSVDAPTNTIDVNNDPLGKHGPGHKIRWSISNGPSQQFTFPDKGIVFRSPNFKCQRDEADAHLFECKDDPGLKGEYKYTVTLIGGSPNPAPYDPIIIDN